MRAEKLPWTRRLTPHKCGATKSPRDTTTNDTHTQRLLYSTVNKNPKSPIGGSDSGSSDHPQKPTLISCSRYWCEYRHRCNILSGIVTTSATYLHFSSLENACTTAFSDHVRLHRIASILMISHEDSRRNKLVKPANQWLAVTNFANMIL